MKRLRGAEAGDAMLASAGLTSEEWTTQFKLRARELPRNPIPDHVSVYDGIAAGDGEAASGAMRRLVDLALEDTRRSSKS